VRQLPDQRRQRVRHHPGRSGNHPPALLAGDDEAFDVVDEALIAPAQALLESVTVRRANAISCAKAAGVFAVTSTFALMPKRPSGRTDSAGTAGHRPLA
jgi:hypothetical protein